MILTYFNIAYWNHFKCPTQNDFRHTYDTEFAIELRTEIVLHVNNDCFSPAKQQISGSLADREAHNGYKSGRAPRWPGGGGLLPENLGGGVRPTSQNLTLFMTKIYDIPYPFYDLTKNSKPNWFSFW